MKKRIYIFFIYPPEKIEQSKWDINILCILRFLGAEDEKMPRLREYIIAYTPPKNRIYITYIFRQFTKLGIFPLRWGSVQTISK